MTKSNRPIDPRPIKEVPFEELLERWTPLLAKFARWRNGFDFEDNMQTLSVVLWNAQQKYDPQSHASFMSYLYQACLNKVRKIEAQTFRVQHRIPPQSYVAIGEDQDFPDVEEEPSFAECLSSTVSSFAHFVATALVNGYRKSELSTYLGVEQREVNRAVAELKRDLSPRHVRGTI